MPSGQIPLEIPGQNIHSKIDTGCIPVKSV
jgi:hypothetical protein